VDESFKVHADESEMGTGLGLFPVCDAMKLSINCHFFVYICILISG